MIEAVLIDILLSGQATARVDDLIDVNVAIVAQQDADATPGVWAGVDVILSWDPAVLEPVSHSICESTFEYFLVTVFMSDDPLSLFYGCLNQGDGDFPDNDGDLHITYFSPLGTEQSAFAIPLTLGTVQFRVLASGNHTVSILPEVCGVESEVLRLGNDDVTGGLDDTYTVSVAPVGIVELLLMVWGK